MSYLITQIFICLLIAAVIGFIIGWLLKTVSCKATQDSITKEKNSLEQTLQETRNTLQQRDEEITKLQKKLDACHEENKKIASQMHAKLQENESKLHNAQESINRLQQAKEDAENRLQKTNEQMKTLEQQKEEAEQNITELSGIINELKTKLQKEAKLTLLQEPRNGQKDNLQLIKGIGPVLEKMLNEIGIYHFDQIASLTPEDIAFINEKLAFSGRIERDDWVAQAKALAKGIETEFAKRVKEGKVPTSQNK